MLSGDANGAPRAHLHAIGTAVPDLDVHRDFIDWATTRLTDRHARALFQRMAARSGITHRWSVLPHHHGGSPITPGGFYFGNRLPSTAARMKLYGEKAPELALEAIKALDRKVPLGEITHLVVASCTGFIAPGIDQILARKLGLENVERTLVGFMGCYAAVAALRVAYHIARSEPTARVLVVTVELSTLHLVETQEVEPMLAMLQFADGAAAAIVACAEDAHRFADKPLFVKALSFVAGNGNGLADPDYDYTTFPEVVASAADAYAQAGIKDARQELAMAEVHDCFTPTELVLMEDLGFAARGTGWKEVLAGTFDLEGELAVNPDGGLKSFGHPIGASGLRMMYECWLQLRGEAGPRRRITTVDRGKKLGLTHNLGGSPGECVSFVGIVGAE